MGTNRHRRAAAAMSLEDLEHYLDAYPDPRIGRIGVSFLDGFLAATIVGPHLVARTRWLNQIFGASLPNGGPGAAAVAAVVARHDEIRDMLTRHPQNYAPIFMRTDTGEVIAGDWADGFFGAIKLSAGAWQPLVGSPASMLLMPIFVFCRNVDGQSISAPVLATASVGKQRLIADGWRHIPEAVGAIRSFWLARRRQVDDGRNPLRTYQ